MASKSKSKHHNQSRAEHNRAEQKNRNKTAVVKKPVKKERGFWLTFAIILVALHGIAAAIFYLAAKNSLTGNYPGLIRVGDAPTSETIRLAMMIVHSLLNVIAAGAIWFWKKWGLYVYAVSAVIALVAGLITVGIWAAFYMVLPVAILGWLLRTKWSYFE